MLASIIIRTLNEAKCLGELLEAIAKQKTEGLQWEVILVDSGSTDGTLDIAQKYRCKIHHITRDKFSFGRSLNIGCEAANGNLLILISGHCIPVDSMWLQAICQPLIDEKVGYSYGRQLCGQESYYSECRIFAKYFPEQTRIPQEGFFCNNANSALKKAVWEQLHFDEELTGLEDMELALRFTKQGGKVGYAADAAVFHYHNENWPTVERRFEREALALQHILPRVHIRKRDLLRYILSSVVMDWRHAYKLAGNWKHDKKNENHLYLYLYFHN